MTRSGQTERTRSGLPCFPDQGGSLAAAGSLAFPDDVSIARGCVTRRWRSQAWSTPIDPRGRLRRQRVCRAPGARLAPHRASSPPRRIRRAPQRIPYRFVRAFGTALERRGRSVCVRTRRIVWSRGCVVACVVSGRVAAGRARRYEGLAAGERERRTLVIYRVSHARRNVLVSGGINAMPPRRARAQVRLQLEYSGGRTTCAIAAEDALRAPLRQADCAHSSRVGRSAAGSSSFPVRRRVSGPPSEARLCGLPVVG